ncbi:MAG: hypothetical protein PHI35_07730 [Victivallaceae bacterium]|nr:hypothetical protein [Victivallaceae bacterium]
MKLEDLVPDLELCKLIPIGEFADTALVWPSGGLAERRCHDCKTTRGCRIKCFPAPTLTEILEKLPAQLENGEVLIVEKGIHLFSGYYFIHYPGIGKSWQYRDHNPASAALRLWLKLKGIEEK